MIDSNKRKLDVKNKYASCLLLSKSKFTEEMLGRKNKPVVMMVNYTI
jgi:hypothetical protein